VRVRHLAMLLAAVPAAAQQWEIGVFGGGGFLNRVALPGAAGVVAGFAPGPSAGVGLGHDLYRRWSGEIRYEYQSRNLRLSSGGATAGMAGEAHVLQYDVLWQARPRHDRVRPYLVAGAGFKRYRGTGAEAAYRPLMEYAFLTRTAEWKPMVAVGAGIRWRVGSRLVLRLDVRDQATPFPHHVIAAAGGAGPGAWLNDIVPSFGVSWEFGGDPSQ
jgi:hypothetical protein